MKIIGITGKSGAGKSTLAGILSEKLQLALLWRRENIIISPMADPIYRILSDAIGMSPEFLKANKNRHLHTFNKTVRQMLQAIGHGMREVVHPEIWIQHKAQYISKIRHTNGIVIIDDIRYLNEVQFLKKQPHSTLIKIIGRGGGDNHDSETELDDWKGYDFLIDNHGTMEMLEFSADLLERSILNSEDK